MIWADRVALILLLLIVAILWLLAAPGAFVHSFLSFDMMMNFWRPVLTPVLLIWLMLRAIDLIIGGPRRRRLQRFGLW
jgi:hypothetical protein